MRLFADAASSMGVRVAEGRALPVGSALRGRRGQTALLYEEEGGEGERQTSIGSDGGRGCEADTRSVGGRHPHPGGRRGRLSLARANPIFRLLTPLQVRVLNRAVKIDRVAVCIIELVQVL
jgi:hypothetical protein